MVGLIFIILAFITAIAYCVKLGIEITANDMYEQHKINSSERTYILSWEYLIKKFKDGIQS